MCFDRYEIHIQAFANVFYGQFIIFKPHLRKVQYNNDIPPKNGKTKQTLYIHLRNFSIFLMSIFAKIIFPQDGPIFFLYVLKNFGITK